MDHQDVNNASSSSSSSSSTKGDDKENDVVGGGGEGYTPFDEIGYFNGAVSTDVNGGGGTDDGGNTFFFACAPPSTEDDGDDNGHDFSFNDEGGGEGVFFAGMTAFPSSDDTAPQAKEEKEEFDYRTVADGALRALEEEYTSTLQFSTSATSEGNKDVSHHPSSMEVPMTKCTESSIRNNNTEACSSVTDADDIAGTASSTKCTESSMPQTNSTNTPIDNAAEAVVETKCDQSSKQTKNAPQQQEAELKVDKEAVLKAMSSIKLKAPSTFTAKFDNWSPPPSQKPKPTHEIIPSAPLSAFFKSTPKAIQATHNLSRSATMAEALHRLTLQNILTLKRTLVIHVVGVDEMECKSESLIKILFGPFVRWIGASFLCTSVQNINIILVGPNVPREATSYPPINLLPPTTTSSLQKASATCINNSYHDYLSTTSQEQPPDFAIAFNAGLWGYTSWLPTLDCLCLFSHTLPFIVTSYTVEEGEDDAEVLVELLQNKEGGRIGKNCWECEVNPFGSKKERETKSKMDGRVYRENGAWQCWLLGGAAGDQGDNNAK